MAPPDGGSSFQRLMTLLISLAQRKAYATVTISLQKGQIGTVKVEHTFLSNQIPESIDVGQPGPPVSGV